MGFAGNIGRDRGILAVLLDRLGLSVTLVSPLLGHASAVAAASERLGLVAPGDRGSIVPRHSADSLLFALARPPFDGERWLDVGSGAGFPGLVLACCYPATEFTLSEPASRRAGFLDLQVAGLGLGNVRVEARRVQELDGDFDVAVTRALSSPEDALLTLRSQIKAGGVVLVAVGPEAVLPQSASEVRIEDLGVVDSPGRLFMMSRNA